MTLSLTFATTHSDDLAATVSAEYRDLAPMITRQRLVVEGYPTFVITDEHIKDYLSKLSS